MGYFPNGTEGEAYLDKFCYRCVHLKDEDDGRGPGCPVWDLHLLLNYHRDGRNAGMLDSFIPRDEEGYNLECRMFVEKK